ncbi:DUF6086 family protein [Streptomyces sp. NPDC008141]|uniref:DUF6086 family protein n=1 Tax=Streptomyces sp. NPDC008141 TaxID=3364815 RepID=UPI0036EAE1B1
MSMYFDVGDETLWNPSNGAGRLFLRQIEVFEAEVGLSSGIGQGRHWGDPDTREVDPVVYAEFVRGLITWHSKMRHSAAILTLSEGFVATAVALARRAGIEVKVPEREADHMHGEAARDVQVPGHPRAALTAVMDALDARAREVDRWMAR